MGDGDSCEASYADCRIRMATDLFAHTWGPVILAALAENPRRRRSLRARIGEPRQGAHRGHTSVGRQRPETPGTPISPWPCSPPRSWSPPAHEKPKRGTGGGAHILIPLTSNEIRRLFSKLVLIRQTTAWQVLDWSDWRRQRQAEAKANHYRKRLEPHHT